MTPEPVPTGRGGELGHGRRASSVAGDVGRSELPSAQNSVICSITGMCISLVSLLSPLSSDPYRLALHSPPLSLPVRSADIVVARRQFRSQESAGLLSQATALFDTAELAETAPIFVSSRRCFSFDRHTQPQASSLPGRCIDDFYDTLLNHIDLVIPFFVSLIIFFSPPLIHSRCHCHVLSSGIY